MNEHLALLFTYVMPYHKGFTHIVLLLLFIQLTLTQFGLNSKSYGLRIRYFLPLYHSILTAIIFTGLLLLSAFDFRPNFHVWSMILGSIALIGLSAVTFRRLKRAIALNDFISYKNFALKSGILSILIVVFVGFYEIFI